MALSGYVAPAWNIAVLSAQRPEGNAAFLLAKIEGIRFRRPVRPGETLYTVVENVRVKSKLGVFALKGYVNGELAAEATTTCVLGTMDNMK